MTSRDFQKQAITLIDDLKSVCANYGLGNDGNEYKIITQVFLYKFLNDKFAHEVKRIDPDCFYILDDVRLSSGKRGRFHQPTGWRSLGKRK